MTNAPLPTPIAAFLQASNEHDAEAIAASFSADALVNDQQREFWGRDAIKAWAEKELVASKVKNSLVEAVELHGNHIVRLGITGDYDKTGLPDPLVMDFYFSVYEEKISQLIILLNKPGG